MAYVINLLKVVLDYVNECCPDSRNDEVKDVFRICGTWNVLVNFGSDMNDFFCDKINGMRCVRYCGNGKFTSTDLRYWPL